MRLSTKSLILACAGLAASCSSSSESGPAPAPPAEPPGPEQPSGALTLRPGEVADLAVDNGVAGIELVTADEAEEYVLVLASTKLDAVTATPSSWSVSTEAVPEGARASLATGCSLAPDAWRSAPIPTETPPSGTAVAQGTKKTLHMSKASGSEDIEVEAIAVGKSAVVWADVTPAHPATLDPAFVSAFLTDFEDLILPRARSVFGIESDLDGDGHVGLVFTPLTNETAVAFFSSCDLVQSAGCKASNAGEYLYLTPPNAIQPPYNTPNAVKEILAHELSHLVHYNRKVLRNQATSWPDSGYMIEGFGAFAQDAIGPQAGNLYVAKAGLDQIADFSLGDVMLDGTPYDQARDGVMRGGAYLFVRWLYDRAGGDTAKPDGTIEGRGGPAFLRAVLEARESVAKALPGATKSTLAELTVDFYTALVMSNRDEAGSVAPSNPCFSYLPIETDPVTERQRGANVFVGFHGSQMNGPATTKAKTGKLHPGGVTYVTVSAIAGQGALHLGVNVDPKALPRVRVGRIH